MAQGGGDTEAAVVKALVAKYWTAGLGSAHDIVQQVMNDPQFPHTTSAVAQLRTAFGEVRGQQPAEAGEVDYDDVVQQSFPASDPPPLP